MAKSGSAYLDLPADERFETRLPSLLKRHAEAVAALHGESLSHYVTQAIAARVADDLAQQAEWRLTVPEQVELLRVLSRPAEMTPELARAARTAREMFGIEWLRPDDGPLTAAATIARAASLTTAPRRPPDTIRTRKAVTALPKRAVPR
jgi:uncharacterized protein (DUF1778 family)